MAYIDNFFVSVTDQPVSDDSQAFISPHTDEVLHFGEPIWGCQTHAMVDSG